MNHRIVTMGLSEFHDNPNEFELLVNYADGREIGYQMTRETAVRVVSAMAEELGLNNFNGLSNRQTEILALLAEEAAEVIQATTKILRHGLESHHPTTKVDNMTDLSKEVGDFMGVIDEVENQRMLSPKLIESFRTNKIKRSRPYLHHQRNI